MSALRSSTTARPLRAGARAVPVAPAVPARRAPLTALPGGVPERGSRPRFELVRAPLQARSRVPFLALCMSILGAALLCALLLNTSMARGSYELSELRREVEQVAQDTQTLQSLVRAEEAALPDTARALGMVEAEAPVMLRLSDGAVLGVPEGTDQP